MLSAHTAELCGTFIVLQQRVGPSFEAGVVLVLTVGISCQGLIRSALQLDIC